VAAFYPQVSKVGIKRYRIADRTPDAVLIHLEVMLAAFCFLYIKYFRGVSFNDYLGLERMTLFFSRIIRFLAFFRTVYGAFRNVYHNEKYRVLPHTTA
jgi:hypothetical protein